MLFPMMTFLTIAVVYEDHPLSLDMVLRLQKSTSPSFLDSMIQTYYLCMILFINMLHCVLLRHSCNVYSDIPYNYVVM